jgi:mannose-6-phosphate isomerase-like protein (cupin superfamily)
MSDEQWNTGGARWMSRDTTPTFSPFPGITMWSVSGEGLTFAFARLDPRTDLPEHHHPHEQAGTVIEGELEMTIDGATRTLGAGEVYLVPGNAVHSGKSGPDGCLVVDVFAPPREGYGTPENGLAWDGVSPDSTG